VENLNIVVVVVLLLILLMIAQTLSMRGQQKPVLLLKNVADCSYCTSETTLTSFNLHSRNLGGWMESC